MLQDRPDAITDTDVVEEMERSFLEYGYSVIFSRALPDARDGLKPVHRRILYGLSEMGLRPEKPYVKCARVVGDVMGKLHPHGDSAIYDSLVRMAQWWSMRVPLVDGHGNFGSLGGDDPQAAMRYTECRMGPAAVSMTADIDEDTVDWSPTYDGHGQEPTVLPAGIPNLLVNGSAGIAVGMATNMPPHNLGEVVAGLRALIADPDLTLEALRGYIPGPDFPTGGHILGLDGVREAQTTGRGKFRLRATAKIEDISARRKGIVVTELPYGIGPEKVIARVKDLVSMKKLAGVSNINDLSDRKTGLRLVIEVKTGYNPKAVLDELYRTTQLEESFGQHNLALSGGAPKTLTLLELCQVYLAHRTEVVRRRTTHRLGKAEARAHILEGLVIALANIDEVVATIRSSKDSDTARKKLCKTFTLTDVQAQAILDMTLRRLTSLEVNKLKDELREVKALIAELRAILDSPARLAQVISDELGMVADAYATPRLTRLLDGVAADSGPAELEIPDEPCLVTLSTSGLLGRAEPAPFKGTLGRHDVLVGSVATTKRGRVGLVTSAGRLLWVDVVEVPDVAGRGRGGPVAEFAPELGAGERVVALVPVGAGLALATRAGVVKRVAGENVPAKSGQEVIGLKDGDELVAACVLGEEDVDLVFVTSDAQLLRTAASSVRPQGRSGGGVAGVRLGEGAHVVGFGLAVPDAVVVTVSDGPAGKVTPVSEYPAKGRGTGGVRCQRLLRGESALVAAWVGTGRPVAGGGDGALVALPEAVGKRDGSGTPLEAAVSVCGAAR